MNNQRIPNQSIIQSCLIFLIFLGYSSIGGLLTKVRRLSKSSLINASLIHSLKSTNNFQILLKLCRNGYKFGKFSGFLWKIDILSSLLISNFNPLFLIDPGPSYYLSIIFFFGIYSIFPPFLLFLEQAKHSYLKSLFTYMFLCRFLF